MGFDDELRLPFSVEDTERSDEIKIVCAWAEVLACSSGRCEMTY